MLAWLHNIYTILCIYKCKCLWAIYTFAAVDKWKTDLDSKVILPDGRNIPCVLVGNKCDQKDADEIDRDSPIMSAFCKQRGFIGWFATSAKANTNVEDACKFLVDRILENDKWTQHGENMLGHV